MGLTESWQAGMPTLTYRSKIKSSTFRLAWTSTVSGLVITLAY